MRDLRSATERGQITNTSMLVEVPQLQKEELILLICLSLVRAC